MLIRTTSNVSGSVRSSDIGASARSILVRRAECIASGLGSVRLHSPISGGESHMMRSHWLRGSQLRSGMIIGGSYQVRSSWIVFLRTPALPIATFNPDIGMKKNDIVIFDENLRDSFHCQSRYLPYLSIEYSYKNLRYFF